MSRRVRQGWVLGLFMVVILVMNWRDTRMPTCCLWQASVEEEPEGTGGWRGGGGRGGGGGGQGQGRQQDPVGRCC